MARDEVFAGDVPRVYDELLVPLIFEPYAVDLVERLAKEMPRSVLEVACGTGAVTRHLASGLPAGVRIVATDLNPPMIERARAIGTSRPVEWRQADALSLPFDDGAFDAVVCQFGVMFFPDKVRAFSEARRVLSKGGRFLFSVWDPIETNVLPGAVVDALAEVFPSNPPRFLVRTPHGHWDREPLARDLRAAGFPAPVFETVVKRSRSPSADALARAICLGTNMRGEIEERGDLRATVDAVRAELIRRFGDGPLEGPIQATLVSATA